MNKRPYQISKKPITYTKLEKDNPHFYKLVPLNSLQYGVISTGHELEDLLGQNNKQLKRAQQVDS